MNGFKTRSLAVLMLGGALFASGCKKTPAGSARHTGPELRRLGFQS